MTFSNDNSNAGQASGFTRRGFLARSSAVSALLASEVCLSPFARAGSSGTRDVLVQVSLRGGMDGLTACVPYGDGELYNARPGLAITPPGTTNGALDLDGFFGLPPTAAALKLPFDNGHLAIVHAAGSTDPTRSHFDATKALESGLPEQDFNAATSGWLGRHLAATTGGVSGPLQALALGELMPIHLEGAPSALPVSNPAEFSFPGQPSSAAVRERVIRSMYSRAVEPLASASIRSFETIAILESIDFDGYTPANGASYPDTSFGQGMKQAAAMIKANIGLETISIDYGGWDHHNQLGPVDGVMAAMLFDFAAGLVAFYKDMRQQLGSVTLVALSEFGRRVAENGSAGLDHGHGNCMFVMGGSVAGGQVHATWPGLAPSALDHGDLAITTDYRDVLSEILVKRMGTVDLAGVFPGHTPVFPGVII